MMQKKHILMTSIIGLGALLVIVILAKGLSLNSSKVPSALLNKPAMEFSIPYLHGQTHLGGESLKLSSAKGKPTIVNFWASWCVSCREEARLLEAFWKANRDRVMVIGIAVQDTPEAAKEFIQFYGKTYPIGIDTDGKVGIDYGVYGVPETFFIDADGVIRHKEAGPVDAAMLSAYGKLIGINTAN